MLHRVWQALVRVSTAYGHYGAIRDLLTALGWWMPITAIGGYLVGFFVSAANGLAPAQVMLLALLTAGATLFVLAGAFALVRELRHNLVQSINSTSTKADNAVSGHSPELGWAERPAEPDLPIADAIPILAEALGHADPHSDEAIEPALRSLRQAARLGQLTIWGRKWPTRYDGLVEEDRMLEPIGQDYWSDHHFNTLVFIDTGLRGMRDLDEADTQPVRRASDPDREVYVDVHLNRAQVSTRSPARMTGDRGNAGKGYPGQM
jgi:hypothetical protein